jgi:protein-S-isoprenylcysteine O-methyltransferase Ste14
MAVQLLLFFTFFFVAAFFWPSWRLWKRHRVNAFVLPSDDSAQGLIGRWFRGTMFGILALLSALALGLPESALGSLLWLDRPALGTAGWLILAASLIWIVAAQAQMGGAWRIGIDSSAVAPLVDKGVFAWSRNPIFLGMRAALLGQFLMLPNAVTLTLLLLGEVLIQVQVRLEESHLGQAHGPRYEAYRQAVRRWI